MGNRVGARTRQAFGTVLLGRVMGLALGATGNAIAKVSVNDSIEYTVTNITVWHPNKDVHTAVIGLNTTATGSGNISDG